MGNPFLDTIERLRDERDGFRNGQAQLQVICDDLQDAIKKYAPILRDKNELIETLYETIKEKEGQIAALTAENDRLKTELAAAAFNELPF